MKKAALQPEQILFAVKRTKWERDLQRFASSRTVKRLYQRQLLSYDRTYDSHKRQLANIDYLRQHLPAARFVYREELPYIQSEEFALMASLGGDNHFVYSSHFNGDQPIAGVNSDPETSIGALLQFEPQSFLDLCQSLINRPDWREQIHLKIWSRIEGQIHYPDRRQTEKLRACTSEITVRSRFHDYISRYLIRKNDESFEEHKCTGLLLSTGAGSTGWFKNCHPIELQTEMVFANDAPLFRVVAREPGYRLRESARFASTAVQAAETLQVVSRMDGEITIDADPEYVYPFPPGAIATFQLGEQGLPVLYPPPVSPPPAD
ncbi:MAG: hypothetical protein KDK39_06000 [Leptospiraceae bacterium]|nr:hypothetical protein [Leptospiraceae bacterium]